MFNSKKSLGFTLIELIIVITIIGILATLAFPSYEKYIIKTRRIDGQTALLNLAAQMEHYFFQHHTYAGATIGSGNLDTDVLASNQSPEGWYTLSITTQNTTDFSLKATPNNTKDTLCDSLTLDSLGIKNQTGTGTVKDCW
ncbi:MAG: prepilin-type N-terminal cleavage/methylation domain-containing protein [Proteobacteria bacterium]|nr:prepilin-type N-terminal cleavage/methylation domain-containing protein [Pseudomonadota bacterium]